MNLDIKYQCDPEIISSKIDNDIVMMSLELGKYYGLNPVGRRIWELFETPQSITDIMRVLIVEYDVSPDDCQKDVVLYTGCGINALPDSLNSLFDVMTALNIDYGVLDGTHNNACCGRIDLELGNWNSAERLGKIMINRIK